MKRRTAEYVEATDLFEGCNLAWESFCDGDPDCSWGNNNRTLVTADTIFDVLNEVDVEEGMELKRQIDIVLDRIGTLGDDFYVDLEN